MRATVFQFAAASLFAALTNAQTYTDCNPMLKTCPADPALSGVYQHTYGGEAPNFKYLSSKDAIKYGGKDGAVFRIAKPKDAPTIVSNFYIMWGKYEVVVKPAPGAGIVSSVVLQSDDLDEIDWEWLGGKPGEAQSNYFGKGNTATYDRGAVHPTDSQARFHKYGIDWTAEKIDWLIDDVVVRTLRPNQVKGDFYPQTPMTARLGSWAGGDPGNEQGVIGWSGGPTDYTKGPFDMVVQSIYIQDYSTGKEYTYSDKSGSAASIKSNGGSIMGGGTSPGQPSSSSPSSPSSAPSSGSSSGPSSSFNAPSNSGRIASTTSKSEPTPTNGSGCKPTNTNPEATQKSPSPSSPPSAPSGSTETLSTITRGAGFIATGNTTAKPTGINGTTTGAPRTTNSGVPVSNNSARTSIAAGVVMVFAGVVSGWLL